MATERIRKIGNDTEIDSLLNKHLTHYCREAYVEIDEQNYCMPVYFAEEEQYIKKLQIRNDDVIIAGHPKTGTTWCQEMVWLLLHNFDYEGAKASLAERFPFVETLVTIDFNKTPYKYLLKDGLYYEKVFNSKTSPRCLKTHLPWSLLPEQIQNGSRTPKIISLIRNPQDLCISYYYHARTFEGCTASFDDFCKLFMCGRVIYGPFWKNILSYWDQRHRPNVLIVHYKDMIEDLAEVVRTVAKFLEVTYTDEQLKDLLEHLSFENMKKNDAVNHSKDLDVVRTLNIVVEETPFMRSGKEGGYKTAMDREMIEKFKAWTEENLKGTDLVLE